MGSGIEKGLRRSLIAVAVEMVVCGTAFAQVAPQAPAQAAVPADQEAPVVVVHQCARPRFRLQHRHAE
jgi:iron complex outermembrane receptor protein